MRMEHLSIAISGNSTGLSGDLCWMPSLPLPSASGAGDHSHRDRNWPLCGVKNRPSCRDFIPLVWS